MTTLFSNQIFTKRYHSYMQKVSMLNLSNLTHHNIYYLWTKVLLKKA